MHTNPQKGSFHWDRLHFIKANGLQVNPKPLHSKAIGCQLFFTACNQQCAVKHVSCFWICCTPIEDRTTFQSETSTKKQQWESRCPDRPTNGSQSLDALIRLRIPYWRDSPCDSHSTAWGSICSSCWGLGCSSFPPHWVQNQKPGSSPGCGEVWRTSEWRPRSSGPGTGSEPVPCSCCASRL